MIKAYPALQEAQRALDQGRYVDAARLAMSHARAHPQDARGVGLLGSAAMRMGALGQAEQFLRQALALAPEAPLVLRELASCVHQQERLAEALELFAKVEERSPDDIQTGLMITLVLDKLGRADEARDKLEKMVQRHPTNTNVWLAYALNLRAAGRTSESVNAYRKVTEVDPERGDAWWGMANIKTNVFKDEDVVTMQYALAKAVDVNNGSPLHFALARALHERQSYERAFHHYLEGNRLWAESLNYNADELTEEVEQARRLFDRGYFEAQPEGGDPSDAPIFIVSLPRSGSTLLEQMLGSHGHIEPLGEMPHIPALLRLAMESATRRGITSVPEALQALSPADRTAFGRDYLRRVGLHRKTDASHFTDKLPHNWSNVLFIQHILPNARIIDIRRDAIDCCFSNFTYFFSRAHASSFALTDIARAYVDYVRLMDHLEQAAPGLIHHLRYEQLIDEPEQQLRGVLDYLGLPWDEACLRFHESSRNVRTPSAEQVRRPLNREGLAAWKPYEQWLGPLREALGPLADA